MFCPTCGKDNSQELKFCASCGTNLEAVSQALTGVEEDFFSKMDSGMDYFIARYAEHVFKDAYSTANEKFFTEAANRSPGRLWETNFIVNAWQTSLDEDPDTKAFGGTAVGDSAMSARPFRVLARMEGE